MSKVNGTAMLVQVGGVSIVGQISGSFNMSSDILDATTKDSTNKAKEREPGETEWGGTVDSLYDPAAAEGFSEAIGYIKAGTQLTVRWGQTGTGETYYEGSAYINNVSIDGPKNELTSYSIEFIGDGEWTEGTV